MTRHILAAVAAAATATPAAAQNALGDGTALDNNLMAGGTGRNAAVHSLEAATRFQNAIVTGNAPGGISFRGDVGYRAPGEFAGNVGIGVPGAGVAGDATFRFRREAFFSGIGGRGIRGTEALQLQFQLMTGGSDTSNLRGTLALPRPQTGTRVANISQRAKPDVFIGEPEAIESLDVEADIDYDRRGGMLWNIRAPSAYISDDALRAHIVGRRVDEEGREYDLTASSLGFNRIPVEKPDRKVDRTLDTSLPGLTPDQPRQPGQQQSGQQPGRERPDDTEPADRPAREPGQTAGPRTYEDIIKELERYQPTGPDTDPRPEPKPGQTPPAPGEQPEGEAADEPPTWDQRLLELRRSLLLEPEAPDPTERQGPTPEPRGAEPEPEVIPDREIVDLLKRSAGQIDVLSPIGAGGVDAYTLNMNTAEKLLAQGRYFDAEERFIRAAAARNGDPMARIGRVHAELGAGLYLSATLNLRSLFSENPEIIGVEYADDLLPAPKRIERIKSDLRAKLKAGSGLPNEAAILLAYLGYQSGDQAALTTGLAAADEYAEAQDDTRLERLVELMRAVWTAPPAPDADE